MLALLAIRVDQRGGIDWRYYHPPAEPIAPSPAGSGQPHAWYCKPCEFQWFGPEELGCWLCDQPGVRR